MIWMMRMLRFGIVFVVSLTFARSHAARAAEPLTEEAEVAEETAERRDAAALYLRAAREVKTDSPAASNLEYPGYPPYGEEWDRMAEESWTQNAAVFPLVRQARAAKDPDWPKGLGSLNHCRKLANIVGDAALYQHFRGDDRAAVELVRDLLHLGESLRKEPEPNDLVRLLVSVGIDALNMHRLVTIVSGIRLTDDPAAAKALHTRDAAALIKQLLEAEPTEASLRRVFGANYDANRNPPALAEDVSAERAAETSNRAIAERAMAAMSLGCHLFRHEKGRWPQAIKELATKLPRVPLDPWGDGKQTMGYVLVKGGLPDSSDRPLVYCRMRSEDGLFYRVDRPQYSYYFGDGTAGPHREQRHGGQFRDVARWTPSAPPAGGPTTRPLKE